MNQEKKLFLEFINILETKCGQLILNFLYTSAEIAKDDTQRNILTLEFRPLLTKLLTTSSVLKNSNSSGETTSRSHFVSRTLELVMKYLLFQPANKSHTSLTAGSSPTAIPSKTA